MRLRRWSSPLLAVFLTIAALLPARSQTLSSPKSLRSRLDAAAPALLRKYDVPSVAVAYIHNGALAWTAIYGDQSPGVPATGNTLYEGASLTSSSLNTPAPTPAFIRLLSSIHPAAWASSC